MRDRMLLPMCCAAALIACAPPMARASFHLMQIQQAIGGVNGDTAAQAVQLRLRFPGDTALQFARLRAWDSAGENPVTLVDFDEPVANGSLGANALIATEEFADYTSAPITPDFVLAAPIPDPYLSAGRITFEGDDGTIYWLLSFGGDSYTGSTLGSATNDRDGDFGPPFSGAIPSSNLSALLFQGSATDFSTSNAADYALTDGPALFTNNGGTSVTVVPEPASGSVLIVCCAALLRRRRLRQAATD